MRARLYCTLVMLALVAAPVAAGAAKVLVRSSIGIEEVDQDRGWIAWNTAGPGGTNELGGDCESVLARRISGRPPVALRRTCSQFGLGSLALVGGRAAWVEVTGDRDDLYYRVMTAALDDRHPRLKDRFDNYDYGQVGDVVWVDGDEGTLAYGWHTVGIVGPTPGCDYYMEQCEYGVTGGGARRFDGAWTSPIPGVGPVDHLSVNSGRVAFRRPGEGGPGGGFADVRDAASGALVSSFAFTGELRSLALSGKAVALLLSDGDALLRVETYDIVTGAILGFTPVPKDAGEVDVDGTRVVFTTGRGVWVIESPSAPGRRIWTGRGFPLSISLDGRRVVWATTGQNKDGRVMSFVLP